MWQLCMIQKWRLHPFMSLFSMKRLRVWASKVPQAACETFLKRVSNVGPLLAELLRSSYQVIRRPAVFLVKVGRKCSQSSWFLLKLQLCIATWNMASLQVYLNEKIFWYLTMTSSDYALFLAPFFSINFKVHWWSFGREMKIEVMLFQRLMEVLNSCKFLSDLPLGRLLVKLVSTSSNMFATWIWGIYFPQNLKKFALCIMSHWASILQLGRVLTDSTGVSMATHLLDWMLMTYSSNPDESFFAATLFDANFSWLFVSFLDHQWSVLLSQFENQLSDCSAVSQQNSCLCITQVPNNFPLPWS